MLHLLSFVRQISENHLNKHTWRLQQVYRLQFKCRGNPSLRMNHCLSENLQECPFQLRWPYNRTRKIIYIDFFVALLWIKSNKESVRLFWQNKSFQDAMQYFQPNCELHSNHLKDTQLEGHLNVAKVLIRINANGQLAWFIKCNI